VKKLQLTSLFVAGCVLAGASRISGQSQLLDALPADTVGVLAVDDIDHLKEVLSESRMGQLWADVALDDVRAEVDLLMDEVDGKAVELTGSSPFELLSLLHGPMCFAVLALEPRGSEVDAAVVWMLDAGEEIDTFSEEVDRFVDWLVDAKGMVFKTETYGDTDAAVMVDPEVPTAEARYGFVDSVLVISIQNASLERDVFGEIVDGLVGEARSSFTEESPYRYSLAATSGVEVRCWLNAGELVRLSLDMRDQRGTEVTNDDMIEMGLTNLSSFAATVEITPERSLTKVSLGFSGLGWMQEAMLAGVDGQDPSLMQWVPESVSIAQALDLDLSAMFDAFLGVMMARDPEAARDMIADMSEMEAGIGFHPRDDLLDNLNGQIAMFTGGVPVNEGLPFSAPSAPAVNYTLMLGLSDGEAMSATLDGVVRSQGMHVARQLEEFEGYSMYSMPVLPGVMLCYAVLDDLLVLSLSPSMVKDVLRRKANPELPSLMTVKDVIERDESLPPERTALLVQSVADQMTGVLTSIAALPLALDQVGLWADEQGLPRGELFDFMDLAESLGAVDPAAIEKYYRGTFSLQSMSLSEEGILFVSTGP
jgi:hypothetical protein